MALTAAMLLYYHNNKEVMDMPRIKGESAEKITSKNNKEYYKTRLDASANYNKEKYEQLILRVPKDCKAQITEYVRKKAEEDPDNPKYSDLVRKKPSVNAFLTTLVEEETGIKLKN